MATKVKIGSARIDENGNARGGKAGDQTGIEVSMQNYYQHKKGWRVFRCIDPNKARLIADDMQYACGNSNIGYDQDQRNTLYNIAKEYNFNCSKVKTKCETDCSALVRVCCAYAGISLPNFTTLNEAQTLLDSGYFQEMKGDKYTKSPDYLKRGDILVTKTQGHTVVVLNNGQNANINEGKFVVVTGKSVNIRKEPSIDSMIIGIARWGDRLPFENELINNRWFMIQYHGMIGYISNKYSRIEE